MVKIMYYLQTNIFLKDTMSILDMNNNKIYITNKFDIILSEIAKLLNLEQNINTKKTVSVKANLELLEERKKIKIRKTKYFIKKKC
jgi:hypothetical protein